MARTSSTTTGVLLVLASALIWSFGATLGKFAALPDIAAVVFWRSLFGFVFLLLFVVITQGGRGSLRAVSKLGLPGATVTLCFAAASTSFVLALQYTSAANILLIQASVPLISAVLGWLAFGDRITWSSILAIVLVIAGFTVMFGNFLEPAATMVDARGGQSIVGIAFAVCIALCFAIATVVTRHAEHIPMTPAVCLATLITCAGSWYAAQTLSAPPMKLWWLFLFGAVNLGLGLALFTLGARLIPAVMVSLIGTMEPVLGPVWVWLIHGDPMSWAAIIGGAVVLAAIYLKILIDWITESRSDEEESEQAEFGEIAPHGRAEVAFRR